MKTLDFKTSAYFSKTIVFVGIILIPVAALIIAVNLVVGIIMLLLCLTVFTSHYRLRLDFANKSFYDYLWILGIRSGDKGQFDRVEYLFIKKSTVSQRMQVRVASTTMQKEVYDGYLRFSEQGKVHLATHDSKKRLVTKLRKISELLNVKILDYSEGVPSEIN